MLVPEPSPFWLQLVLLLGTSVPFLTHPPHPGCSVYAYSTCTFFLHVSHSPNVQFQIRLRNTRRCNQHLDTTGCTLVQQKFLTGNPATEVDMVGKSVFPLLGHLVIATG